MKPTSMKAELLRPEAFLVQMVGTEHITDPYSHCTSGSGVFTRCVTVDGLFGGSYTNYYYR